MFNHAITKDNNIIFSEITDVFELLLFLSLQWLSFALMLTVWSAWVVSVTDSSCKIRSSVNGICSADSSVLVSFVSDW